jgi:hypothetical protein
MQYKMIIESQYKGSYSKAEKHYFSSGGHHAGCERSVLESFKKATARKAY